MVKVIAFTAMIIDHGCIFFYPEYEFILRSIGTLSFPLFAYMITQGLKYTKDLKLYLISLITCACIAQPVYGSLFPDVHRLNDLYILLFGLITIILYERYGIIALNLCPLLIITNVVSVYIFVVLAIYFLHHRLVYLILALAAFFLLISWLTGDYYHMAGSAAALLMHKKLPALPCPGQINRKITKYFYYVAYPLHFWIIALLR